MHAAHHATHHAVGVHSSHVHHAAMPLHPAMPSDGCTGLPSLLKAMKAAVPLKSLVTAATIAVAGIGGVAAVTPSNAPNAGTAYSAPFIPSSGTTSQYNGQASVPVAGNVANTASGSSLLPYFASGSSATPQSFIPGGNFYTPVTPSHPVTLTNTVTDNENIPVASVLSGNANTSDVPGSVSQGNGIPSAVPEPSSLLMMGMMVLLASVISVLKFLKRS